MSNNFVNDAIFGKYNCNTCGGSVGQFDFFDKIIEWWNSLDSMYRYAIIGGAGLLVVVLVFAMVRPTPKAKGVEQLEELARLKMLKELAE